jgi:hypothetical protein
MLIVTTVPKQVPTYILYYEVEAATSSIRIVNQLRKYIVITFKGISNKHSATRRAEECGEYTLLV